jgi:hypothetical protein
MAYRCTIVTHISRHKGCVSFVDYPNVKDIACPTRKFAPLQKCCRASSTSHVLCTILGEALARWTLVLLCALLAVAATYWVLKKWKLHPLFISVMMGMVAMAIMYTLGRAVTGEGDVWWRNLLSGLGNGAWIGGLMHVVSRWQAKRAARSR